MPLSKGDLVSVEARTGPGMNKEGGVGRITVKHKDNTVTVKYVHGGTERVEAEYVSAHETFLSPTRSGRTRSRTAASTTGKKKARSRTPAKKKSPAPEKREADRATPKKARSRTPARKKSPAPGKAETSSSASKKATPKKKSTPKKATPKKKSTPKKKKNTPKSESVSSTSEKSDPVKPEDVSALKMTAMLAVIVCPAFAVAAAVYFGV